MLVFTLEIWPLGDRNRRKTLFEGTITNDGTASDGTGNAALGNYDFKIEDVRDLDPIASPRVREFSGRVEGFERLTYNALDLLRAVLNRALGSG